MWLLEKVLSLLDPPMDQTGQITIQYHPDYISTLDSDQYFSAVLAPTVDQLKYYQGKKKVNIIDVDCAAIEMQDQQGLQFISNKIKGKGGILSKSNSKAQDFVDFEIYNKTNLSSICAKSREHDCNFENPYCKNLYNFRIAAKIEEKN